jgi:hypothetical protein
MLIARYNACSLPHLPLGLSYFARLTLTRALLNAPRLADQASFRPLTSSGLPRRTWRFPPYLSALRWPSRNCRNASSVSGRSGNRERPLASSRPMTSRPRLIRCYIQWALPPTAVAS